MDESLRRLVWQRADSICEYCRVPQPYDVLPFQIDHIIAEKHHGLTIEENLALSCYGCNAYKGPNIAGLDPATGQLTRLFHPRQDNWNDHFEWHGPLVVGRTAVGRVTIDVLRINLPERVEHRRQLITGGVLPG
ncbi:HNH endonuclease [Candidatus Entotheonella palauensis]|uniref:HNH endonuclease n=1 Tax=Candidatus Entotheonella palauensis TaxID=93172 RepID=UPI000B7D3BE1|nr:HNH endonuclease signature motif containing protein [Candidatus Entotheonella palauensis]